VPWTISNFSFNFDRPSTGSLDLDQRVPGKSGTDFDIVISFDGSEQSDMKRRILLIVAGTAFLVTLILLSRSAASQDFTAGERLAARYCERCHNIGRTGVSRLPIAPTFRDIANRYSVWGMQEALAEGVVVGHPAMPKFVLTPEQIFDLLSYMDTLKAKKSGR
jgi:mono/diheme cytochrome c family protein